MADKALALPKIPHDEYYEDYVAALLMLGGYYLEKRICLTEPTNVLELDIVTTSITENSVEKTLSEIKSGSWGLSDVFKVRGWLDYLKYAKASFVSLNCAKKDFAECQKVAEQLGITLLDIKIANGIINNDALYQAYGIVAPDKSIAESAVPTLRYACCLERILVIKYLRPAAKDPNALASVKCIDKFFTKVMEQSFFIQDPNIRIQRVFEAFVENKNITARYDTERFTGESVDPDQASLCEQTFRRLFYETPAEKELTHAALYTELICRLTVLKLIIEEMVIDATLPNINQCIRKYALPNNLQSAMQQLSEHHYFYRYPYFWQIFIFLFGGFILTCKKDDEYRVLSELTNIPIDQIDNALLAFDILFKMPGGGSWFVNKPNTCIRILQFMPLPLAGLGANFRRLLYRSDENSATYENLEKCLTGKYTVNDLIKYNNLAVEYLYMDKTLQADRKDEK